MAIQAYLWALPLVSYAQWKTQHRDVFGATDFDLVHYLSYRDLAHHGKRHHPVHPELLRPLRDRAAHHRVPPRPNGRRRVATSGSARSVLGEMVFRGQGGKYLILAPASTPPDAEAATSVQSSGVNVRFGFRTLDPNPARAGNSSTPCGSTPTPSVRIPRPTRIISPAGREWTADQPGASRTGAPSRHLPGRGRRRARPLLPRHAPTARDQKGGPFAPDERLSQILERGGRRGADRQGQHVREAVRARTGRTGSGTSPSLTNSAQRGHRYDELVERAPGSTRR